MSGSRTKLNRTFNLLTKSALAATATTAGIALATSPVPSAAASVSATSATTAARHPAATARKSSAARQSAAAARLAWVRKTALAWAYRQAGTWYCWSGTGPSCYDCSGLVFSAYRHAGVWLPRTTYGMLDSRKLRWIPARDRRPGDLAFYGPGHVELVTPHGTFGALDWGSPVWWHTPSIWFYPTMYYELRT